MKISGSPYFYRLLSSLIVLLACSANVSAQDVVAAPAPAPPQMNASHSDEEWTVNFKDTDIRSVIQQIGKLTGDNFIIAPGVSGKVDVVSQVPMKKEDIRELFLSILHINGFSVSGSGKTLTIQPSTEARKNQAQIDKAGKLGGGAFIVRVLPLKFANANDLMLAVQPLVSDFAVLKNLPDSNALLIADYADNVRKVAQIVSELDYPETDQVDTVKLVNTWVPDVMPQLEKLAPRELDASGKIAMSPVRLVGDERRNVIMIKGERASRTRLHNLITRLDQAMEDDSTVQVIPLQNVDATKAADMLKDMFTAAPVAAAAPAAGNIASVVTTPIPVSIKAHVASNSLVIHAPPDTIAAIRKVIARLDVQRTQILIESAIVEIDDDMLNQLGVQFGVGQRGINSNASGFLSTSLPEIGSSSLGTPISGLAGFLQTLNAPNNSLVNDGVTAVIGSHDKFTALISALSATSRANLLSTPSITTVNNEEATIVVGQNVPFRTGSYETPANGGTLTPFTTIQRQDVGITLKVTPQVNENNRILLKVDQEVSSVQPTTLSGAADIITNKRSINTSILALNGQTVAIGGLISDNKNTSSTKVPFLGDIPYLGALFRSNEQEDTKNDLVVFLRPTVVGESSEMDGATMRKFNGLWELNIGRDPKWSADSAKQQLNKVFSPTMIKNNATATPWLARPKDALPWLKDPQ